MKLDNIIYDVDSLASAIAEQWNTESAVFKAMYPSDTTTSLINVFAGYGSMLQYMLLGAVANCYTTTAFSKAGIYQLAETLGNNLHGNLSSQVLVMMTKTNFTSVQTIIPAKTQFTIKGKKFFNPTAIIIPAGTTPVEDIVLVQGEILSVSQVTSGIPNEKFYFSSDFKANPNYVKVFVNGEEWGIAESFLDYDKNYVISNSQMNTVVLKTEADGRSCIKVGDNQLASLPASGSSIVIEYVSNDGAGGNIAEINLPVSLVTSLQETENNVTGSLTLDIKTTSTAFGGSNTQSLEILRYSSPYVFASGHRAVRRQDYIALLLNECGYLACNVWGEYEEAEKVGAYDALMMNMVYYTGIKSFQQYPAFTVSQLSTAEECNGSMNTTNGFWGSFSLIVNNLKNSASSIVFQDSGGQGLLFINNNAQDPRDSLLPLWKSATELYYRAELTAITVVGAGYSVNQIVEIVDNPGLALKITEIDNSGGVIAAVFDTEMDLLPNRLVETEFATTTAGGESGSGLKVKIKADELVDKTTFIFTNEDTEEPGVENNNPIRYAQSDNDDSSEFYMSRNEPTLQKPVQIFIDFTKLDETTYPNYYNNGAAIVGFKLKASAAVAFPGIFAMFATESKDTFENDTVNIRNSSKWDCIIQRTLLDDPTGNTNTSEDSENTLWSNWISTNLFNGTSTNGEPNIKKYKYYVIEIYSLSDVHAISSLVGFKNIKFLLADEASVLYYDNNGNFKLKFPTKDSAGPDGNGNLTIGKDLINTSEFPLWAYTASITNANTQNGYYDGNLLAYKHVDTSTPGEERITPFLVNVVNADTGVYRVSILGDEQLTGTSIINTGSTNPSLDTTLVFNHILNTSPAVLGMHYTQGETIKITDGIAPVDDLRIKVLNISQGHSDGVNGVQWIYEPGYEKEYKIGEAYIGQFKTYSAGTGENCEVIIEVKTCSGLTTTVVISDGGSGYAVGDKVAVNVFGRAYQATVYNVDAGKVIGVKIEYTSDPVSETSGTGLKIDAANTLGSGGQISISTSNNLSVTATFTGNRIDTSDVTEIDQPIIKKYNHFTTYTEFKQPATKQESIKVQVSLKKDVSLSSGVILQNVSNALYSLFELTPNYIGQGLKLSKIYTTVMGVEGVEWCKVITPTTNIEVAINEFLVSSDIRVIDVTEA